MKKIQWNDRLSIGVELIDDQHKQWIEHYNTTKAAMALREGPGQIPNELQFLIDYTNTHFATEESLMEKYSYPETDAHKSLHNSLKKTLGNLVNEFEEEGATHVLSDSIDTFMGNWLENHIQEVDMKLGAFLKKNV